MIDEDRTLQLYGYTSDELKPQSHKPVVAVCDECGGYRVLERKGYRDICRHCSPHGKTHHSDETKEKIALSIRGRVATYESRVLRSASRAGVSVDEWVGFACDKKYCNKFNECCRENIRDKYDRACFICSKTEEENRRRLDVHHVDMNKDQGCNDHEWKLVPLCRSCHMRVHTQTWQARIEYLLS